MKIRAKIILTFLSLAALTVSGFSGVIFDTKADTQKLVVYRPLTKRLQPVHPTRKIKKAFSNSGG